VTRSSDDGVFVAGAPERISPLWLGGLAVTYDRVREGPPVVVLGEYGAWALHDRHRETVTYLDETAQVIGQTPFDADPEHYYRNVTTMRLDPLQHVTVANDFVAVRDAHGEVARLRTDPWGAHCGSLVAFDDDESLLCLAVPDDYKAGAEPSARSRRYGRPARLVLWDWQREVVVQDVPLCSDHAGGYGVRKHPKSDAFYVDAHLNRGDQRAWIFARQGTTLRGSEIESPQPMEAFAPDGTCLVVQSGETRDIKIGERHMAAVAAQLRLVSWPELSTRAQLDGESVFRRDVQNEDGLSGPVCFLSGDDLVIETVRGRQLLVDRSMTVRGVLALAGRPSGDEGLVVSGIEPLGDGRFVSYGSGRYDVWVLADSSGPRPHRAGECERRFRER